MDWEISPSGPLRGEVRIPGDKSITHRAYILGALGHGRTTIHHPLRAEDTDNTLKAVRSLGLAVRDEGSLVVVDGLGPDGLKEPGDVLDLGNSGTGVRLLAGAMASRPFFTLLTGDASLRRRPMGRITKPLRMMGAEVDGRGDGTLLPLSVRGGSLKGIAYASPVASAQVKSCVLLAALGAEGITRFHEPSVSRDHSERMLLAMGVRINREGDTLLMEGGQVPRGTTIGVPGDISSAAFFLAAAAVVEGSDVTLRNIGINPTRIGILDLLREMGAQVELTPLPSEVEPAADIRVRYLDKLRGIQVPEEWIPSLIDELPLAAVLGACAEGETTITGAGELRVKESDRIASTVGMLASAGIEVAEKKDGFSVKGGSRPRGTFYQSRGDHRIAMSSAVLSLLSGEKSLVKDTACVDTSFPGFWELVENLCPGTIKVTDPG